MLGGSRASSAMAAAAAAAARRPPSGPDHATTTASGRQGPGATWGGIWGGNELEAFLRLIDPSFVKYERNLRKLGVQQPGDLRSLMLEERDLTNAHLPIFHARKIIAESALAKEPPSRNTSQRRRAGDSEGNSRVWYLGSSLVDMEFLGRVFRPTSGSKTK